MSKQAWLALGLSAIAAVVLVWASSPRQEKSEPTVAVDPAQIEEELLAAASEQAIRPWVQGVFLGMQFKQLKDRRPAVEPIKQPTEPGLVMFVESLGPETQALYVVRSKERTLERLQIQHPRTPTRDLPAALELIRKVYGKPDSLWDCVPEDGGSPARRYVWLSDTLGVTDAYVVIAAKGESPETFLNTLVISSRARAESATSRCRQRELDAPSTAGAAGAADGADAVGAGAAGGAAATTAGALP